MCAVNAPPVVDQNIEDAQYKHKEGRRPLGLEADGNHSARRQADQGHEGTSDAPLAAESETNEEEDKQKTARKQEANKTWR